MNASPHGPERDVPIAATWQERRRARKLRRAELRLADAEHHLRKWGFANTPSQNDHAERRIEKLRQKVEGLL